MKFSEDMIGKRVREHSTGDEGFVSAASGCSGVIIDWLTGSCEGFKLYCGFHEIEFLDDYQTFQEITIDGKRYKLVPVEEE